MRNLLDRFHWCPPPLQRDRKNLARTALCTCHCPMLFRVPSFLASRQADASPKQNMRRISLQLKDVRCGGKIKSIAFSTARRAYFPGAVISGVQKRNSRLVLSGDAKSKTHRNSPFRTSLKTFLLVVARAERTMFTLPKVFIFRSWTGPLCAS